MRLNAERKKGQTHLTLYDGTRVIATAAGADGKEAARWLIHHLKRIVTETKKLLADAGLDPPARDKET